jgi:hypothetical protein
MRPRQKRLLGTHLKIGTKILALAQRSAKRELYSRAKDSNHRQPLKLYLTSNNRITRSIHHKNIYISSDELANTIAIISYKHVMLQHLASPVEFHILSLAVEIYSFYTITKTRTKSVNYVGGICSRLSKSQIPSGSWNLQVLLGDQDQNN